MEPGLLTRGEFLLLFIPPSKRAKARGSEVVSVTGSCGRRAGKSNGGTMKRERGARLWCGYPWGGKGRWRRPPRKRRGDERATGLVDRWADPAHRRRAVGNRVS